MKLYQLIAAACISCITLFSCANNTTKEDNELNNHPALDTVNVPDSINNVPIPVPDSTIKATDTVAVN